MNFLRIIFLTLIFAITAPAHSANTKKPTSPWTIENIKKSIASSWSYLVHNTKNLFSSKKTPPKKPTKPKDPAPKKDDTSKKDPKKTPPKDESPTPPAPSTPEKPTPTDETKKPKPAPDKPIGINQKKPAPNDTKKQPTAGQKAKDALKKYQVIIVAWYKTSVVPNAKKLGPWVKKQAKNLWDALKKARKDFKKYREEKKKKAEEELKNPNPARLKWVNKDPYGSFGYDGFNLHKGTKNSPFKPNGDALDPETHFKNRTEVRTEPPVVEKKTKEATTTIAKLGGVPSSRVSRMGMTFTNLAEHDHTMNNMLKNGCISFLAHTLPNTHEMLPAIAKTDKLIPLNFDFTADAINANGKRVLFLLNANILQYLVSHCIAYKSIPTGLKKAVWDDTNIRNLSLMIAGLHLFKKDAFCRKKIDNLSNKFKYLTVGILGVVVLKILLDQLLEGRNIIFEIKQELAGKPEALGIKDGYLPTEMKGNRYIVFNSTTSRLISFITTCLNSFIHAFSPTEVAKNPAMSLVLSGATAFMFGIKAIFSIQNTYLLESDLQYLSPKLKARVEQHVLSHKIITTMSYAITLATFAQTATKTPYIIQQLRAKRPQCFSIATLETLKKNLPEHLRKQVAIDAAKITSCEEYYNGHKLFKDSCINLLLLNIQQSTDPAYAEIQPLVAALLAAQRPNLLARLKRYDEFNEHWNEQKQWKDYKLNAHTHEYEHVYETDEEFAARKTQFLTALNNARSPVFSTKFPDPTASDLAGKMMDLLAQDILDNNTAFAD